MKDLLKRLIAHLPESIQAQFRKLHYQRKLKRSRISDEPDLAAISLLTKPGDVVFDLGANFGLFTRFLSESVGVKGRVFSFEPTGDMFEVLQNNCQHLGLSNIEIFKTALSDRTGVSEMSIPIREDGTLNHYEASLDGQETGSSTKNISVETSTLDDFCAHHSIGRVDFIKCDVEGHEIAVLNGARETLLTHRPSLLLEVNQPLDQEGHGANVLRLVRDLGYEVFTCREEGIAPWQPGEICVNYVLKPVAG